MKFFHLADLHLDSPMRGAWAADVSARLGTSTLEAFSRGVDFAVREGVDGVFLAGDLYDRRDRSLRARLHLQRQLERLALAGIPSFVVHGNHDPLTHDDAVRLPPLATVFGTTWSEVEAPGGKYRVQGVSYGRGEVEENLARAFHRTSSKPTIGVLHSNLAGSKGHADYAPCTLADLTESSLDYWALGHVHTRATYQVGAGLAAYPGNPQGRHVRELGARGGLLVEVDDAQRSRPQVRFVALDVVRWYVLSVDLGSAQSIDEVFALVLRAAASALDPSESIRTHIFRVTLVGATSLHRELRRLETQQTLEERLGEVFAARRWLVESLVVDTGLTRDLSGLLAAGGLVGEVAQYLQTPAKPAELEELWVDAGLDVLDGHLAAARIEPLDRHAVFLSAVSLALDHLVEEDS